MDSATSAGAHRAVRPSWDCEDCAEPWPCPERKARLLSERPFDRLALLLFLSGFLTEAIDDFARHGVGTVPDLYNRFLGWALRVTSDS
ncbi:hypothetical protein GCM10010112_92920 [Actinoplanes lobatus]|uniref:Flavin reductase n=1 Tax=Actinoplanes lobatus TaxID=113568 RepID=A0A7W7HRG7_9ACTN|nr:hypothetical protein [Actinoplanes lobatus]MBB4755122.1 hypothetical protein [Actinoplanes lobatus]GGN99264.1 hypothetical protein GCM10010112_92920 [Actinoplanes lobatus]GIE40563.1 hypothetical protein Alo02nite_34610 [Actinoplanes lobatus]